MLFAWGIISFHNLPVEAYPDVANNYVQVITQWPGRAAEEVEQQVTIPLEIQMAGIPHMTASAVYVARRSLQPHHDLRRRLRLTTGTAKKSSSASPRSPFPPACSRRSARTGVPSVRSIGTPCDSTNPLYDTMELKSLEDWTLEKQFKSVPGVVDVSSFGGITREYQVRVDPDKLVAYGLSIGQVEQQLANNNVNAGGSFIEQGKQQINVREVGLYRNVSDIEKTVLKTQIWHRLASQRHRYSRPGSQDPPRPDRQDLPRRRNPCH